MTRVRIEVDMTEFVEDVVISMSHAELLDLVKQIDLEVGESEFTEELRDYFAKEMESEDLFVD